MNRKANQGFTLIELMLAMSFLAVLLVAIALTIIQIGNIYNHGLTLKAVDQAGVAMTSDVQTTIEQSSPFSIDPTVPNSDYVQEKAGGTVTGGRLCLGQYSYIWNYGIALNTPGDASALNIYSGSDKTPINFVKVPDPGASYCLDATTSAVTISPTNAVDMLNSGDHGLAIHTFTISSPATSIDTTSNQRLYNISLTIGTNETSALQPGTNGNPPTCLAPGQSGSDPSYCSVNTFTVVARAGNTVQ